MFRKEKLHQATLSHLMGILGKESGDNTFTGVQRVEDKIISIVQVIGGAFKKPMAVLLIELATGIN